jgi:hypothetical protein
MTSLTNCPIIRNHQYLRFRVTQVSYRTDAVAPDASINLFPKWLRSKYFQDSPIYKWDFAKLTFASGATALGSVSQ